MKISKRLEAVASFVPDGSSLADIGTDHGLIPIYLARTGRITHGIAADLRTGPLERARENIARYCLFDRIEARLSDGLLNLRPGEADTVVIAGIGGDLVIRILEDGRHMWESVITWVLSPQSELDKVRHYLQQHGFCIQEEAMLYEEEKYYTVMKVIRGTMTCQRMIDFLYGKFLLDQKHPVMREYLQKEIAQAEELLKQLGARQTERAKKRRKELLSELEWMREAYCEVQ